VKEVFGRSKKDKKACEVYAVAAGKVIPVTEVKDEMFSEKLMGDGYAVLPIKGEVFAPIAGTIKSIFPTKHAIGIETENGIEVLLHMGVDTVELQGEPFEVLVKENQKVAKGDKVALMDISKIEKAGKATDLIIVFTNQEVVDEYKLAKSGASVEANEVIGTVSVK